MPEFKSQYDWSIQLPAGWEPLDSANSQPGESGEPVVFGCASDWSLSITWIMGMTPVEPETASRFAALTSLPGRLPADEIVPLLSRLFPAIGKIEEATAVDLLDGRQGLETIETFRQGDEIKKGYQFIFPASVKQAAAPRFQRLCFYAPAEQFARLIADVQSSCRSFHLVK